MWFVINYYYLPRRQQVSKSYNVEANWLQRLPKLHTVLVFFGVLFAFVMNTVHSISVTTTG